MIYKCICGQEFDSIDKLSAHKSNCRMYIESKGINFDEYWNARLEKRRVARKKSDEQKRNEKQLERASYLEKWISEKHMCEKCGKIMTEIFGSGRFCSRTCANTRCHSEETKLKIKESIMLSPYAFCNELGRNVCNISAEKNHNEHLKQYNLHPRTCMHCGKKIPYKLRHRKTCSDECFSSVVGGFREGTAKSYKYGTYQNISCDSSYELAFVVYCLEHSISFKRNVDVFPYMLDGVEHLYIPDFKIKDTYIEVKGYHTDIVDAKAKSIPKDIKYIILYEQDLKPCIDYCVEKYGKKYWEVLYDKNKPSCNDKKQA